MNVDTINIRSFNLHTPEYLCPATDDDSEERSAAATTNYNGDTIITDPVSIRVFQAPTPDPLNDEALRVVVANPMAKTNDRSLSPLTESGGTARPLSLLKETGG